MLITASCWVECVDDRADRGLERRIARAQRVALDEHVLAGGLLEALRRGSRSRGRTRPGRRRRLPASARSRTCRHRRRRRRTPASRRSRASGDARSSGPCGPRDSVECFWMTWMSPFRPAVQGLRGRRRRRQRTRLREARVLEGARASAVDVDRGIRSDVTFTRSADLLGCVRPLLLGRELSPVALHRRFGRSERRTAGARAPPLL